MTKFSMYYEEGGNYTAKAGLEIEAATKEEAKEKFRKLIEDGQVEFVYSYEESDSAIY